MTGDIGAPPVDRGPSLGAQALWLLTAKTIGFGLAIALPVLLVRRMSQEEFGLYKQAFFIVATVVNVLPLGFGMSAFYFLPRERARQGSVVANILVFHVVVGALAASVLVTWPGLLATIFSSPALPALAGRLAVVVALWSLGSFLEIVTVALQDVRASTGFIVISQFSKTLLLVIAAAAIGTVDALVTAAIVQGVVQVAMLLVYLHVRFPGYWRAVDPRLLRAQAAYALPLGSSSFLLKLQQDVHHAFVSHAFGPAAYAIYAVGVLKLPLIGILRESVGSVVLPRINELEARQERRPILLLVAAAARRLALVYYPIYACLMVIGADLITLLFTSAYASAWPVFAVALTMVPFNVIVLDPVIRAHEQRYFILRLRLVLFLVLTAALWFGAASLGLVGVIAAVVAANLAGWLVSVVRMARMLEMRRSDLRLFRDVAAIGACAVTAAAACAALRAVLADLPPWTVVAACVPAYGLVYVAALFRFRAVRPAELKALWTEVSRAGWPRRTRLSGNVVPATAAVPPVAGAPVDDLARG